MKLRLKFMYEVGREDLVVDTPAFTLDLKRTRETGAIYDIHVIIDGIPQMGVERITISEEVAE